MAQDTEPTAEDHSSLEAAMSDAGLGESTNTPPPAAEPVAESPAQDPPPATEPVVEPPAQDPPPATEPVAPDASKQTNEEREAARVKKIESLDPDSVKPPPGTSPKNIANFDTLRDAVKHFKKEAADVPVLRERVAELEKLASSKEAPKEVMEELQSLRDFKKLWQAERDPEFQEQFSKRLTAVDDDITSILRKNGATDEFMKKIEEIGGVGKISMDVWEKTLLPTLNFVDRQRVERQLASRAEIEDEKAKEVAKFSTKQEEYLANEKTQSEAKMKADIEEVNKHLMEITKDIPWAHPVEVPKNGTPAEKKAAEDHNKMLQHLEGEFQKALLPTTMKQRAEVAAAAVASIKLAQDVNALTVQLEESNRARDAAIAEVNKLKSAGRLPTGAPSREKSAESGKKDPLSMSNDDAIEAGLQAAEAGE